MNFYIDASNIHTGGGKTMLNDFLTGAITYKETKFFIWVDDRFDTSVFDKYKNNIEFHKVKKLTRFYCQLAIRNSSNYKDRVICFGNLPPIIRFRAKTFLFQSSRYMVEDYSTKGLPKLTRIRIGIERFICNRFNKNVDEIIVQSNSMKVSMNIKNPKIKTSVKPFKDFNEELPNTSSKKKNTFIYVASVEPHKNHKNLLDAWVSLAEEEIYPKLYLTIDDNSGMLQVLKVKKDKYNLDIENFSNISRENLMKKFSSCNALIYPSFFESYGLPLVEAKMMGIDVIASELDFVRDMIDPSETFNPHSSISIARAVKRYMKHDDTKTVIIRPQEMIDYLLLG